MQSEHKKLSHGIPRFLLIVAGAAAIAFAMTLLLRQASFRNRLSDALIIEALLLSITSWLSHLKSGKLAFITFRPFKKKTYPRDWKERIPKLGSPPFPLENTDEAPEEETEKSVSPEDRARNEKIARRFQRDLAFAGAALLAIGLIVQYL